MRHERTILGVESPATQRDESAESTQRALAVLVQLLASLEALDLRRFGDLGLTLSQLRVLHLLRDHPASCGQLAEHLGITASTATALIDRLVRRGLLERRPRPGDRRVTDLALSEAARNLLPEAAARKGGEIRAAVEELAPADREQLAALLDRVTRRLQSAEAQIAGHPDGGEEEANPVQGRSPEVAGVLR